MLFNSLGFLIFFPTVAVVYYLIGNRVKWANLWLLLASYYFYMQMRPVYALILLASTAVSYSCGLLLQRNTDLRQRKAVVAIGLVLVVGILFFMKYFNFLNASLDACLTAVGIKWQMPYVNFLLPIGISFFTFQSAGYIVDVYRGTVPAEKDFSTYALFVSFFPVILAGPIQRAKCLIPQLKESHPVLYDNVVSGLKMMVWGYFMKLCVADRLGTYVDSVFDNLFQHNGTSIAIASFFYTIQIYGDFAGYSLVALGCAKTMGFHLPDNFRRPYFSTSFKEFWKRWHIGLSSWFGDYLYIPLGGNRVRYARYLLNLLIVFLVSGLWHGAAWTFVAWGALHGVCQIIEAVWNKLFGKKEITGRFFRLVKTVWIFLLVNFAWILFRADSIGDAFMALTKIFTEPGRPFISAMAMLFGGLSLFILFVKDYADEFHPAWKALNSDKRWISIPTTAFLLVYIVLMGVLDNSQFIYFQF